MDYEEFLRSKRIEPMPEGIDVASDDLPPALFDWQAELVRWALGRGRAALFAATGLGKTIMQLAWAERCARATERPTLIFAPLAVSAQTVREAERFGIAARVVRHGDDVRPDDPIVVCNIERMQHFDPTRFGALVLDESSILKSMDGATRTALIAFGRDVALRLACTATPAPNDWIELGSHSEFLGVMNQQEMLALFYTQDGNSTQKWRLKGHAVRDYWRWVASWAVALRSPADMDAPDAGFVLPPREHEQVVVGADDDEIEDRATLFAVEASSLQERQAARRVSVEARAQVVADRVNADDEPWVVWCALNSEAETISRMIPGAVNVTGSDPPGKKEAALLGFSDGSIRVLVTKPTIAGFGMNWQHCARVAFLGLGDSWEQYHQAVRRCWRFGQTRPVKVLVVTSAAEGAVVRNIERKERQAEVMLEEIVSATTGLVLGRARRSESEGLGRDVREGVGWTMHLGDCVDVLRELDSDSAGLALFSPPFPGMYVYTDSPRDMGNVASLDEMVEHYRFLAPELLRVVKPGRTCAVHLTQVVAQKRRDGFIGLRDFRGRTIAAMEDAGWNYYGEVAIDKDPQVKAIRTKDRGLLFKTLATDSANMHMALADYVLQFRKPGENAEPIRAGISEKYGNTEGWITAEEWIEWAAPVWYRAGEGYKGGIRETDVLNVRAAREEQDERHLAPLQLGVIERCVKLWTNPGDVVLSPFGGIGSEGYGALTHGRRYVGVELKRSYFEQACRNLAAAADAGQLDMLAAVGQDS
jgi:DNA modification methylase/superfamily II DNA or RNA helicase